MCDQQPFHWNQGKEHRLVQNNNRTAEIFPSPRVTDRVSTLAPHFGKIGNPGGPDKTAFARTDVNLVGCQHWTATACGPRGQNVAHDSAYSENMQTKINSVTTWVLPNDYVDMGGLLRHFLHNAEHLGESDCNVIREKLPVQPNGKGDEATRVRIWSSKFVATFKYRALPLHRQNPHQNQYSPPRKDYALRGRNELHLRRDHGVRAKAQVQLIYM